jgi:3-methyl-2-oxobutanoate hydroxymethyltransferase
VIYLQAPVETLIERVHRRGVDFERTISAHYLARLADAYSRYFYQYDATPLMIINSERLNFVEDPDHFDLLRERISAMRGRREFFNLGPSRLKGQSNGDTEAPPPSMPARAGHGALACRDGTGGNPDCDAHRLRRKSCGVCDRAGVDVLLVGDSLGMVIQGRDSTLPVSLADVVYHTRCVVAGAASALSLRICRSEAYQPARKSPMPPRAAMQAGAQMVKLEGGAWLAPTVEFLTTRGIPVCGHVGLLPQSVHALGGYRVQGNTPDAAAALLKTPERWSSRARRCCVVECVPSAVGDALTPCRRRSGHRHRRRTNVFRAGAGNLRRARHPAGRAARFVRNFMTGHDSIEAALRPYVRQ